MIEETIVAVYDTSAQADAAVAGLHAAGVPAGAISHHAGSAMSTQGRPAGFWSSLFGGEPDHDTAVYEHSLNAGSTVVTVRVTEADAARVLNVLESHNPVDVEQRAAGLGLKPRGDELQLSRGDELQLSRGDELQQPLGTDLRQPRGAGLGQAETMPPPVVGGQRGPVGDTIQLAEESMSVGKRVVNRGGTRVRRFVVETPFQQDVTLRDEKVIVDRRPVTDGAPADTADFTDKTIEMTATTEEAVVSKTARVVEEVRLRKEAGERVETVRDTLRKEQADIEEIGREPAARNLDDPRRA